MSLSTDSSSRRQSHVSRRRFLFCATGVAGVAAAGLSGCGDGAAGGITLDLWTWALRPRFDDYLRRLVADFEAKHPGVRVRWADVAFDAMARKTFAAGAAGAMPDVVNFSDQHFAQFAGLGALAPLSGALPGDPTKRYVAGALDANRIDGQLVGLPWYLSTNIRVMNTKLLADGGLSAQSVGDSWATLLEQAGPFKAATGAFLFSLPLGDRSDLPAMMMADGIDFLTPHTDGGYEASLSNVEVVDFVRKWTDAYAAGLLPRDSATGAYQAMVTNLTAERVAVINANALARVKSEAPQVYGRLEVGPGIVGSLGASGVAVTHVAVSRQSRHPELAAKLAWHVTSPTWQTELAVVASRVPSTIESLSDPAFSEWSDDPQQQATVLGARQLANSRPFVPPIGPWPDLRRVFDDGIKRVLLEGAELEPTLAEVEREWNRILRADAAGMPYK